MTGCKMTPSHDWFMAYGIGLTTFITKSLALAAAVLKLSKPITPAARNTDVHTRCECSASCQGS